MSNMSMNLLLRRMDVDVTVHGFRSAFRDWIAECTGFNHDTAKMAVAHSISNATESAYRRGDMFEKRRASRASSNGCADRQMSLRCANRFMCPILQRFVAMALRQEGCCHARARSATES